MRALPETQSFEMKASWLRDPEGRQVGFLTKDVEPLLFAGHLQVILWPSEWPVESLTLWKLLLE